MQVNSANFKAEVLESNIPVLLDFGATWCGPCRQLLPILSELELEANGEYKVVKVDIDESQSLASEYGIDAVPTLMLFNNGSLVRKKVGFSNKSDVRQFIKG